MVSPPWVRPPQGSLAVAAVDIGNNAVCLGLRLWILGLCMPVDALAGIYFTG